MTFLEVGGDFFLELRNIQCTMAIFGKCYNVLNNNYKYMTVSLPLTSCLSVAATVSLYSSLGAHPVTLTTNIRELLFSASHINGPNFRSKLSRGNLSFTVPLVAPFSLVKAFDEFMTKFWRHFHGFPFMHSVNVRYFIISFNFPLEFHKVTSSQ